MPPKRTKTEEEVKADYNRRMDERGECQGLSHVIDVKGSCQCGFYIEGKEGGSFPFVPNRKTRRTLGQKNTKPVYVRTDEETQRMQEARERNESRRAIRKLARDARRQERESQPTLTVELLASTENGEAT